MSRMVPRMIVMIRVWTRMPPTTMIAALLIEDSQRKANHQRCRIGRLSRWGDAGRLRASSRQAILRILGPTLAVL